MAIARGTRLGPYEVVAPLGKGGMGEVYRAKDHRLGREVALKILPPHLAGDSQALARFEREARVVAALSHPNILSIHDFGTENSVCFAVMELLEGETLRSRVRRGPLPWKKAIELGAEVSEGLAAAHAKGIIHRDLKPENIFLTADGRVKILDFGLARVVSPPPEGDETRAYGAESVTEAGVVVGTAAYMSPEQVRGQEVDAGTDIFALGCVLYEMMTGVAPFKRDSGPETMAAILKEDPPDLAGHASGVPAQVESLLRHCVEKNREYRFHSARDLTFALNAVSGSSGAITPSVRARALAAVQSSAARRSWKWLGAAAALLVLAAAAWLFRDRPLPWRTSRICYTCFWDLQDPRLRGDLTSVYRRFETVDDLVAADVRFILWRTNDTPDCQALEPYREIAERDTNAQRRYLAWAILGFSAQECGGDASRNFAAASQLAGEMGLTAEAATLRALSRGEFKPRFADQKIVSSLNLPPNPRAMILGESKIEISPQTRIGAQVDRVARDWLSYQMHWDMTEAALPESAMLTYHEGALLKTISSQIGAEVFPLTGAFIAYKGGKWFASDETGTFRFPVLDDKVEYPTTHQAGSVALIEDTHGVNVLVSQALERKMQLVFACGDSEGKGKGAFYLAERGVDVIMPGDRYASLLLGYRAKGTILGTSPLRKSGDKIIAGNQPVRFSLDEKYVAQDTKQPYPLQYYDTPARYFRKLSRMVPLKVDYVMVDGPGQMARILERADKLNAHAVAVRVYTDVDDAALRRWLKAAASHRAILFHSSLYPFAQALFDEFPEQVTFGDLKPRFE